MTWRYPIFYDFCTLDVPASTISPIRADLSDIASPTSTETATGSRTLVSPVRAQVNNFLLRIALTAAWAASCGEISPLHVAVSGSESPPAH